jgi:hypothetical protein
VFSGRVAPIRPTWLKISLASDISAGTRRRCTKPAGRGSQAINWRSPHFEAGVEVATVFPPEPLPNQTFLLRHLEFIIALLLGLISIVTAYASFQATVYNGQTAKYYADGTALRTKAESYFVEDNQTFVQDAQLFDQLTELRIDEGSSDPEIAALAQTKYDTLYGQSVSKEFDIAIKWADKQNAADPTKYANPTDSGKYVDDLFSDYKDLKAESIDTLAHGDTTSGISDRLTLNTVLMALSLFLLGIAALVRILRVKVTLTIVAVVIFGVAAVLTAFIPFIAP